MPGTFADLVRDAVADASLRRPTLIVRTVWG
jgi:hypothetical protein